jgi:uncharacterized membrane protein YfhO
MLRRLVVVTSSFHHGWDAQVDGRDVPVHRVQGMLLGVEVPGGGARVVLRYRSRALLVGLALAGLGGLGTLGLVFVAFRATPVHEEA